MTTRQTREICWLGGVSVELGDRQREVESLADAAEQFKAKKLPMNAKLLAFRYFRESTLSAEEAMSRVIQRTLALTGMAAAEIDAMILASAGGAFLLDRKLLPALLARNGLSKAMPMTVTSQECTSLLSAIDVAARYAKDGTYRRILVVSYDRAEQDADRIQMFGVVSDAALACIVSGEDELDFRIKAFAHKSDVHGMQGDDDFASRKALTDAVTGEVLNAGGVRMGLVKKVFSTNFFKPLATFNASALGLEQGQLCADLGAEIGHCLCADSLINLESFFRTEANVKQGDLYLLQAYAPGLLASMLIERSSAIASCADAMEEEMTEQSW
jgi:3-oxoacyl-[acyl-carrier-protein] synthase-3